MAQHQFLGQVDRFQCLQRHQHNLLDWSRRLTSAYYNSQRSLAGQRLLRDKEPLEPIAFPDKDYSQFLVHVRHLLPQTKYVFMIRDPIATVWSMRRRAWGVSLATPQPRTFSVAEHTENWCACADLMLHYRRDPNTYICAFHQLAQAPAVESERILAFLQLPSGAPFVPQPTKNPGFSEAERDLILKLSRPQREALTAQGLLPPS